MSETRVCRTCGVEKEIENFPLRRDRGTLYRRGRCRECLNAYERARRRAHPSPGFIGRVSEAEKLARWEAEYQKIERRSRYVDRPDPIPVSDPYLDLAVIEVCWRDCVSEGEFAIRRMVKKISEVCWRIPDSDRLGAAAVAYLSGAIGLAMVRARLDECVGLARTA